MATLFLTETFTINFCNAIRKGMCFASICDYMHVSQPTIYKWISKGRVEEEGVYRDFFCKYQEARRSLHERLVVAVEDAAVKDWKAAAYILGHRFKSGWGEYKTYITNKLELEGKDFTQQVQAVVDACNDGEMAIEDGLKFADLIMKGVQTKVVDEIRPLLEKLEAQAPTKKMKK